MRPHTEHPTESGDHSLVGQRTGTSITQIATLLPTQPPGRLTRKARHYLPQIVQLRIQGYTLEAIQQALAAVGVPVSISTVRREAMRPVPPLLGPVASPAASVQTLATPPPAAPSASASASVSAAFPDSGKDTAAAFAHTKSTNPLTRAKERS